MAIVRIPKINNYTIMSNHHLTDPALSLKAKGLMSYMLSRPDNWDFTIEGLACQNKEGADAIARVIRELEGRGYITRCRVRNQAGKFTNMEYRILECPLKTASAAPAPEKPAAEKPVPKHPLPENPVVDSLDANSPIPESAGQIITEPPKTERIKTEQPNLDLSKTDPSIPNNTAFSAPTGIDGLRKRLSVRQLTADIRFQIGYHELKAVYGQEDMDNMLSLIVEVLTSRREYFNMSGGRMPAELVRERFHKLNSHHMRDPAAALFRWVRALLPLGSGSRIWSLNHQLSAINGHFRSLDVLPGLNHFGHFKFLMVILHSFQVGLNLGGHLGGNRSGFQRDSPQASVIGVGDRDSSGNFAS